MRPVFIASLAGKVISVATLAASPWLAAAFFFGPDLFILHALLVPSGQGLGRVATRFRTQKREVWLTIDDGPDEQDTPRILDALDRHDARATFFLIGERAARHPGLVAEIVRRGHEVGHHTQTHPLFTFWCAGSSEVCRELDAGLESFGAAGGAVRWFRGPVGIKSLPLAPALKARNLGCVAWSIRSRDCVSDDAEKVAARVSRKARPGDIILMHEGPVVPQALRVAGVEAVLRGLGAKGFSCVIPRSEDVF